jgi:hypothetical protein
MLTQIINGHILTPQGWLKDGSVLISDGKILEVTNSDLAVIGATVIDAKGMYIVPAIGAAFVNTGYELLQICIRNQLATHVGKMVTLEFALPLVGGFSKRTCLLHRSNHLANAIQPDHLLVLLPGLHSF